MPEFRNDYLHIIIDEAAQLLYSEWVRKPKKEEYKQAGDIFARILQDYDIAYWIQDTNRLGKVPGKAMKEVFLQLVAVAVNTPLRKLARVTTDDKNMESFNKKVQPLHEKLNYHIEVKQFRTYHEAVEWMSE